MNQRIFVDFDGTITKNDVIDLILERFADPEWKNVEKDWSAGRIGSRKCLEKQIGLVTATKEVFKGLVNEVEMDSAFISFLKKSREESISVAIVSDGLDWVIHEVLKRNFQKNPELISHLPIYANKLLWTEQGIGVSFPNGPVCAHGCANCKERIIKSLSAPKDFIIFIGDGLSDRYAARAAHLTFAKNKLLTFCEENKINHQSYGSFKDISQWLKSGKGSYAAV